MTKNAGFRKSELQQLAEVAKREGVRIEMERNGCLLRVGPDTGIWQTIEGKSEPEPLNLLS